jgi:periplasmic divalent cation tolerance protein
MRNGPECAVVSTTLGNESEAEELAKEIVERSLAACVQMIPIRSVYRWKGTVESENECLLLAKTSLTRVDALQAFIREKHKYELPEIVVTPVTGGLPEYLEWICDETRPTGNAER